MLPAWYGKSACRKHPHILYKMRRFFYIPFNSAEVDYLLPESGIVYPIEVKAGTAGKLKSLKVFLEEKNAPFGIKISQEPLS